VNTLPRTKGSKYTEVIDAHEKISTRAAYAAIYALRSKFALEGQLRFQHASFSEQLGGAEWSFVRHNQIYELSYLFLLTKYNGSGSCDAAPRTNTNIHGFMNTGIASISAPEAVLSD
jgi:hypothetical protein